MFKITCKNVYRIGAICALTLSTQAVFAESPKPSRALGPEAFDRLTLGKTFIFGQAGAQYGAEEYFDNRRVRWSFLDGNCVAGEWYPEDGQICFIYDHRDDPQCWTVFENQGLMTVVPDGATIESDRTLVELKQSDDPLYCLGPDVGA